MKKIVIDKDWLIKQYVNFNRTSRAIAKELNVSKSVVLNTLKECGIKCDHKNKYGKTGKYSDIIGNKYNMLKVVNKGKKVKNGQYWLCECECGKTYEVLQSHLVYNKIKSCGCYSKICHSAYQGCGELSKTKYSRIRDQAKNRDIEFNVSIKYLWQLFGSQDAKCAITNIPIQFGPKGLAQLRKGNCTASLDRIDSNKGYIEGNVQWVHRDINIMKNSHSMDNFIELCKLVLRGQGYEI